MNTFYVLASILVIIKCLGTTCVVTDCATEDIVLSLLTELFQVAVMRIQPIALPIHCRTSQRSDRIVRQRHLNYAKQSLRLRFVLFKTSVHLNKSFKITHRVLEL